MADEDKLTVDSIRGYVMYVKVGSATKEFPCVAVNLVMAMNEIPRCSVYMAIGRSISDYKTVEEGAEIYIDIIGSTKMFPCWLYEYTGTNKVLKTGGGDSKLIFKGYLFQAAFDYTASAGSTSIRVKADCIGYAGMLNIMPTNLYTESSIGCIIQRMCYSRQVENANDPRYTGGLYNTDAMSFRDAAVMKMYGRPVVQKLAYAVSMARLAGSLADLKNLESVGMDSTILDTFGGSTRINTALIGGYCDEGWSQSLYETISNGMAQTSVYNCLHRALTSYEFGLNLVPRWNCDSEEDFKTDICPPAFLNEPAVMRINGNAITRIASKAETMSWLHTPDVVIVNFSDAWRYSGMQTGASAAGVYGIASYDKSINEKLMNYTRTGNYYPLLNTLQSRTMKVREIQAPSWLKNILPEYSKDMVQNNYKDRTKGKSQPKTVSEETDSGVDPLEINRQANDSADSVRSAYVAANIVAYNLLGLLYRAESVVSLDLMPNYRFGHKSDLALEDCLGKRIIVDLSNTANFGDVMSASAKRSFYFEGTLNEIEYSWASSPSSSIRYSIGMKSVQFGDEARKEAATYSKLYTNK